MVVYACFLGGHPRAGRVGNAQPDPVREEFGRAHKPNPSRSSFARPRLLEQKRNGQRPNRIDPRVPWLEDDFRFTSLVVVPLGL